MTIEIPVREAHDRIVGLLGVTPMPTWERLNEASRDYVTALWYAARVFHATPDDKLYEYVRGSLLAQSELTEDDVVQIIAGGYLGERPVWDLFVQAARASREGTT